MLHAHLRGMMTLGAYLLDERAGAASWSWMPTTSPIGGGWWPWPRCLAAVGCPSYLEASRRGGHLWFFFAEPLPGTEIRRFGKGLIAYFNLASMELYPKQAKLRTGPGSLIRLPFGVHKKSGRRYGFNTPQGEPLAPTLRQQLMVLRAPETVPERLFEQYAGYASRPGAGTRF